MTEIEKAIKYFEGAIRESDEIIADYSPALQAELTRQKVHFVVALEALREKAEREKGCECCNGDALKYCGIKNSFGSPSIVLFGGTAKPKPEEKFKNCPECGRKLGEGNG